MIEKVEELKAKLEIKPFRDVRVLIVGLRPRSKRAICKGQSYTARGIGRTQRLDAKEETLGVWGAGPANRRGDVIAVKRGVTPRRPPQRILGIHRLAVEIVASQPMESICAGLRCECRL